MVSVLDFVDPALLETIQHRLQRKAVKKNQRLVRQGAAADAFYIIYEGQAEVIRHNLLDGSRHVIAHLGKGDSFGEEALLQGVSRNAEIRMRSDGEVGILGKQDFDELLRPAMAPGLSCAEALKLTESGIARWLDCRFEPEYNNGALADAIMMPLHQARQLASTLDDSLTYVAYCNNGRRSQAVTFLLRERGLQVRYLRGGLQACDADIELL